MVAKGADAVAAKIRELAAEHKVPLLEAPPLARALFRHTELGDEIPATLYTAVAEVLAYVFQLRHSSRWAGAYPDAPTATCRCRPNLDPLQARMNGTLSLCQPVQRHQRPRDGRADAHRS